MWLSLTIIQYSIWNINWTYDTSGKINCSLKSRHVSKFEDETYLVYTGLLETAVKIPDGTKGNHESRERWTECGDVSKQSIELINLTIFGSFWDYHYQSITIAT